MSEKTITLLLSGTDYGRSGLGTYVRSVVPCLINEGKLDNISFKLLGTQADLDAFPELTRQVDCLTIPRRYERPALSALWHLRRGQSFLRKSQTHLALCLAGNRRLISPGVVPSVAVVHDLAQLHMPDKYDGLRMLYFHQFILKGLRAQSRLVAISESTRRDLSQVLDVSESGIRVVYNGVDASIFSRKNAPPELVKQAYKRACALALQEVNDADVQRLSSKPYFYYPARFEHPSKNHTRLLQAFAESGLSSSHQLLLSGADWGAEAELKTHARQLGLGDCILFCGFLPKDDIPLLIQGAAAVVMAGLHEGFGLPALEALAAGVPSCVAETGALPEVVGDLGVQFDPMRSESISSALQRVANDNAILKRAQVEGPRWASGFSWQQTAKELVQECRTAMGTR